MNDLKVESADNLALWNAVKDVPPQYLKKITGGRLNGMSDISPQWRLQVLTERFGPVGIGWYYEVIERWTESAGEEISSHVLINLYVKDNGAWSRPIQGMGGSMLLAKEKSGLHHSDEAFKMALTDALSVACKALGIAASIYLRHGGKYAPAAPGADLSAEIKALETAGDMEALMSAWKAAYSKHQGDSMAIDRLTRVKDNQKRVLSVAEAMGGKVQS